MGDMRGVGTFGGFLGQDFLASFVALDSERR
jgi:hypothetical protein